MRVDVRLDQAQYCTRSNKLEKLEHYCAQMLSSNLTELQLFYKTNLSEMIWPKFSRCIKLTDVLKKSIAAALLLKVVLQRSK